MFLWPSWCHLINSSMNFFKMRRRWSWWSNWGRAQPQSTSVPNNCPHSTIYLVHPDAQTFNWQYEFFTFMIGVFFGVWCAICVLFSTVSASVNISQLEQQLILSLDARHIRQILIELHGMAERPFWRVNSKVRKDFAANQLTCELICNINFNQKCLS